MLSFSIRYSSVISTLLGWSAPSRRQDLEPARQLHRRLQHGVHGAVLGVAEADRVRDRVRVHVVATHPVQDLDRGEDARMLLATMTRDLDLVAGHALALLAQQRDHVHAGAAG